MKYTEPWLKKLGILKLEDLYKYHDCLNDHAPQLVKTLFKKI
jgi:hypothetical protein